MPVLSQRDLVRQWVNEHRSRDAEAIVTALMLPRQGQIDLLHAYALEVAARKQTALDAQPTDAAALQADIAALPTLI